MTPIHSLPSFVFFALTLALSSIPSHARGGGSGVGNGGGIWTCRDNSPEHKLIWTDLVDLSEARREFKLNIPMENTSTREILIKQVEDKIQLANPAYFSEYQKRMAVVRAEFHTVQDSEFEHTGDIYDRTRPAPHTCPGGVIPAVPEQLANFTTEGHLIVNDSIWSDPAMSEMNRAALLVHEAIYLLLRERDNATNSVKTRELVGYLFSDLPVEKYKGLLNLPEVEEAQPTTPAPATVSPVLGLYHAAFGDWANVEITRFDTQTATLYLTERDNKDGHDLNSHVFQCTPDSHELLCKMTDTTNWYIRMFRGVSKHQLRFSGDLGFVWLNQRPSGAIKATRYLIQPSH